MEEKKKTPRKKREKKDAQAMKEPTPQVKPLVEEDLRKAWKELGLDIALPSLNNRLCVLEGIINNFVKETSDRLDLIEQSQVLIKARLGVLENVRVTAHMDFKVLTKIFRNTLAKLHESFEDLKFTAIGED